MGSGERKAPSGVQGQSPWCGVVGAKPPKRRSGGEAEQVLMIIKTFLAEIFLIKSGMYSIIRTLTSVLIFSRQLLK